MSEEMAPLLFLRLKSAFARFSPGMASVRRIERVAERVLTGFCP
jgi:hypothetical protein